MKLLSKVTRECVRVLVADSNQTLAELLTRGSSPPSGRTDYLLPRRACRLPTGFALGPGRCRAVSRKGHR